MVFKCIHVGNVVLKFDELVRMRGSRMVGMSKNNSGVLSMAFCLVQVYFRTSIHNIQKTFLGIFLCKMKEHFKQYIDLNVFNILLQYFEIFFSSNVY